MEKREIRFGDSVESGVLEKKRPTDVNLTKNLNAAFQTPPSSTSATHTTDAKLHHHHPSLQSLRDSGINKDFSTPSRYAISVSVRNEKGAVQAPTHITNTIPLPKEDLREATDSFNKDLQNVIRSLDNLHGKENDFTRVIESLLNTRKDLHSSAGAPHLLA